MLSPCFTRQAIERPKTEYDAPEHAARLAVPASPKRVIQNLAKGQCNVQESRR